MAEQRQVSDYRPAGEAEATLRAEIERLRTVIREQAEFWHVQTHGGWMRDKPFEACPMGPCYDARVALGRGPDAVGT